MSIRSFIALVLFFVGLIDFQRYVSLRFRQQRQSTRKLKQEAIMTWEGEGGNLTPQDVRGRSGETARH
jgi:hypothetical protein